MAKRKKKKSLKKKKVIFKSAMWMISVFIFSSGMTILFLNWFNPPVTSFINEQSPSSFFCFKDFEGVKQKWVPLERVSENFLLAVIASEDQRFFSHFGFDVREIKNAVEERIKKKRIRGASTITQQTAKNLFLWGGKDFLRKGFEAYYTLMMEALMPKERILEIYVNAAELGERIYGVEAASNYYFNKPAKNINASEAALLAAILPNPVKYNAKNPSEYLIKRKERILSQMKNLGSIKLLENK
ncbi:MAG: monofunctional biosynthetic peptidoglycan transglycosylase [Chlorobi bacterium]|nr:monofunctional biosynthetic peptidoglycan transglycosylase [Chlorobiota bacterium]